MEPLRSKEPRNPKKDQVGGITYPNLYYKNIYYIIFKQYDTTKKHTK